MFTPATIDSAAAATAPDAMKRLRPKKNLDAVTASGKTGRGGVSGIGCPNERDLKTSSKVACSFTSPHSGFDPPKTTLHNVRLLGRARTSRSASSEVEMPPPVKPYRGSLGVNTRNPGICWELVLKRCFHLQNRSFSTRAAHQSRAVSRSCRGVVRASIGREINCCARPWAPDALVIAAAIRLQPSSNSPLSFGRRADRLTECVDDGVRDADGRCGRRRHGGHGIGGAGGWRVTRGPAAAAWRGTRRRG